MLMRAAMGMAAAAAFAMLVLMIMVFLIMVFMIMVFLAMRLIAGNGAVDMVLGVAAFMVMRVFMGMVVLAARVVLMVVVMVRMARLKIGPAFGIECGLDRAGLAAEPLDHRREGGIAADAQAALRDLHRQVAATQMPGEAQQMFGVFGAHFAQGFGSADDLHQPPVFQFHRIARAQRDSLR